MDVEVRPRSTEEICEQCWAELQAREAQNKCWPKERKKYLHTMPYVEYLKTPEWKRTREQFIERAGGRCEHCGMYHISLNVHHLTYKNRGYEQPEDCMALCPYCHADVHNKPHKPDWWTDMVVALDLKTWRGDR